VRLARVIARLNVGGPARHVLAAARGLSPEFGTTLLTGDVGPGEAEATAWIAESGVAPERVPGLGRAVRPLDDLRALSRLTARLRELRPDVVHTHTAKAGTLGRVAARRAHVPVVVHTFHGHVFTGYFGRAVSAAIVRWERHLAAATDAIVAVSPEVAHDLVETYRVAPREKVHVIPPGIDVARFRSSASRRDAARSALGIAPEAAVVVWCGRLVAVKDVDCALDVLGRLLARSAGNAPPVLLVAGDGPLRASAEARATPGARFLGNVADVPELLAAADVALLTSRNEGTPVALVEAAAAGLPAVATRVGGVPSVVADGETGLLAPPGDRDALAGHLRELLADAPRRRAMGDAAARRAAELFSLDRMLADLRALYTRLGLC
jgi:glycosyltransferase involved in cell wall biosynthesis